MAGLCGVHAMARGGESPSQWASLADDACVECERVDIIALADRLRVSPTKAGVLGFLPVG